MLKKLMQKKDVKNILLIEDDYLDVESVRRTLRKLNVPHNLYVAHNGVDGLAILTSTHETIQIDPPDLILLDINMPKMNGLEFLKIIKSYYSLKNIPIFIITTSDEDYDRISMEMLGITGYIIKPLDFKNPSSHHAFTLLEELMKRKEN
jgi:CheY-like chemotaxis protein